MSVTTCEAIDIKWYQLIIFWIDQVVDDIPTPIPFDLPLVLIKPQEACPTAEVYKVLQITESSGRELNL